MVAAIDLFGSIPLFFGCPLVRVGGDIPKLSENMACAKMQKGNMLN
jgi:hypothetical protein